MKIEEVLKKLENVNDKMAEQIVAKLPDDLKDKIYKKIVTKDYYKIISTSPYYGRKRDKAISAKLWMFKTREELDGKFTDEGYTAGTVKRFTELLDKRTQAVQFSENAVKGLRNHFSEQYNELLTLSGDSKLDPGSFTYVGGSRYIYKSKFMIHFEYSPQYVWVEQLY